MEGTGTLEEQLEAIRAKSVEIRSRKVELKQIEELGARLEERLILDNRYTKHSTVSLFSPTHPFRLLLLLPQVNGFVLGWFPIAWESAEFHSAESVDWGPESVFLLRSSVYGCVGYGSWICLRGREMGTEPALMWFFYHRRCCLFSRRWEARSAENVINIAKIFPIFQVAGEEELDVLPWC